MTETAMENGDRLLFYICSQIWVSSSILKKRQAMTVDTAKK